jgi:hypothetical protein
MTKTNERYMHPILRALKATPEGRAALRRAAKEIDANGLDHYIKYMGLGPSDELDDKGDDNVSV